MLVCVCVCMCLCWLKELCMCMTSASAHGDKTLIAHDAAESEHPRLQKTQRVLGRGVGYTKMGRAV